MYPLGTTRGPDGVVYQNVLEREASRFHSI
jgi:hypothetical protein